MGGRTVANVRDGHVGAWEIGAAEVAMTQQLLIHSSFFLLPSRILRRVLGESSSIIHFVCDDFSKPYFTTFRINRVDKYESNFSLV